MKKESKKTNIKLPTREQTQKAIDELSVLLTNDIKAVEDYNELCNVLANLD